MIEQGPGASREQARSLARAILRYRYGPDGQPGVAGMDDDGDSASGAFTAICDLSGAPVQDKKPANPWLRVKGI